MPGVLRSWSLGFDEHEPGGSPEAKPMPITSPASDHAIPHQLATTTAVVTVHAVLWASVVVDLPVEVSAPRLRRPRATSYPDVLPADASLLRCVSGCRGAPYVPGPQLPTLPRPCTVPLLPVLCSDMASPATAPIRSRRQLEPPGFAHLVEIPCPLGVLGCPWSRGRNAPARKTARQS
jgi:hypothetical protein